MDKKRHIWNNWADTLHGWGINNAAAVVLESAGPLNILGAQAVYLGQPLLSSLLPEDQVVAIAELLDNPTEIEAFTQLLRQQHRSD